MSNITTFNTAAPYIYLPVKVHSGNVTYEFDAIFDTGAPLTEFSDKALFYAGCIDHIEEQTLKSGLQTKKYTKVHLPQICICGHTIENLRVFVSHFEESWGIDALIGLDFLRRYKVEINYKSGCLISDVL